MTYCFQIEWIKVALIPNIDKQDRKDREQQTHTPTLNEILAEAAGLGAKLVGRLPEVEMTPGVAVSIFPSA